MKNIEEIYLGDRSINAIYIDCKDEIVRVSIDRISRAVGGQWDYNTAHDINGGVLVFSGVRKFIMTPPGLIPNEYIASINFKHESGNVCEILAYSVSDSADACEVTIIIKYDSVHIEDPESPEKMIMWE